MLKDDVKKVLYTEEEIINRCDQLGKQIATDYAASKKLMVVGILKGAVPFYAELIKHIDLENVVLDFMAVSSYEGTSSTGKVKISKDISSDVQGVDVLIVEDIIDTGMTLAELKKILQDRGANSVKICCLLNKPSRRTVDIQVDYNGFIIPDEFVIGYGLDYNQKYRNLPYIGVLKEEKY